MVAVPNLFIIGAPRCGTTSLYAALKQHSQVYTSVLKEPHFYSKDLPKQPHTVNSQEDYSRLFDARTNQIFSAEASVWYLYSPRAALEVARHNPSARVIVLLRSPVEMILSLYHLYLRTGNEEERNADKALLRCEPIAFEHSYFPPGLLYSRLMRFEQHLTAWFDALPGEQIQVVFYEEFYSEPVQSFNRLCRWLGIDDLQDISFDSKIARQRVKMQAMKQILNLPPHLRKKINPKATEIHSGKKTNHISVNTRERLQARAEQGFTNLSGLLGRPLPVQWWALKTQ